MGGSTDPLDFGDFGADAFTAGEFTAAAPTFIYPYTPLEDPRNEIRLLRYKGTSQGLASARLCFEVIKVQCPTGPDDVKVPFYAVSYTWGAIPEVAEIMLDGHEVEVPYSSEVALRGLITAFERGAGDANMPIWMDAICINQRDIAEREKQLSLMGRLYKCAHTVCIWLGPAGIHTIGALQSLNALKNEKDRWFQEHGEGATPPDGVLATPLACNWKALSSIFNVPWFSRVWTIQEVVLARPGRAIIFVGRYSFAWNDFAIAAKWAYDTHRDSMPKDFKPKTLLPAVMMMRVKMRYTLEGGVQISRLLITTISRGVTNQVDRIYGMLGMRPEAEAARGDIIQSYEAPLCASYTSAVATIMETEESLLLLEQMAVLNRIGYSIGPEGEPNWPTWVPRLDMQNMSWGDEELHTPVTGLQGNVNNSLPAPMIRSTPSQGLLHVKGLRIGTVELAFAPLIKNRYLTTRVETDDWSTTDVARHFSYLWAQEYIDDNSTRETIIGIADSLTTGGYQDLDDANNETLIRDFGAMMHKGWELHSEGDRNNLVLPAFTQEGNTGNIATFVENVVARASRFIHFKVFGQKFGMGPDTVRIGDVVVIFLGVKVPLVLRPVGERYSLLGAVYVSGIMQGEFVRNLSVDEISEQTETFDLC